MEAFSYVILYRYQFRYENIRRRMVEIQTLIATIYILYYSLIGVTIITLALIIALVVIISKQK